MIIDTNHPAYQMKHRAMWHGRYNGAYYYSKEIGEFIIPNIRTDRNWVTINIPPFAADHSIVFIHNNIFPSKYDWLGQYKDLVLVCGVSETCEKVKHLGTPIHLPLPIDIDYVKSFRCEKDKDTCYAGRGKKFVDFNLDGEPICDVPREDMLRRMAHYKKVYAVGRTAIEAKLLGCEVLPYDPRFPDPSIWKPFSYEDAVEYLQEKLDEIDHRVLDS